MAATATPNLLDATVTASRRLAPDVRAVYLRVHAAPPFRYAAGQYVRVHRTDGRRRDLSMARACRGDNRLEAWVRYAGGPFTQHVFEALQPGETWRIEGPLGEAGLRDEPAPAVVVAGGTGIGPARAVAEAALREQPGRHVELVCGAHERAGLLAHDELAAWAAAHDALGYTPVLERPDDAWDGVAGTPDRALAARFTDLTGRVAHVFGPPAMVDAVGPVVRSLGIAAEHIRADAFTPGALDLDAGNATDR